MRRFGAVLALLGLLSLTACSVVEFLGDPRSPGNSDEGAE